ncbi:hypothetical protein BU26DRAFT_508665 [Trematosphaeria pertusa]|uniref:Helicase C-terminal domain-containing protein n=1 Tax=Trematosphaeria pertusa TaxID=390896 RepID=A0A6A6I3B8_9PLEO|nr:uncharacterized protein BU26DRAFT_508665 [Trematosphaeria pertusa]KAF2244659.1 hypothetical protein BU26DRAFT_508665 [Trematosphaeria pertusa]
MYDLVECLRYDGGESPEKRDAILSDFAQADGSKVLLMSHAAGGIGLNVVCANATILCARWWKKEWEEQAMKRAYRLGQMRAVTFVTLFVENCDAERYKANAPDRKHKFNTRVVEAITRPDHEKPWVWGNLR